MASADTCFHCALPIPANCDIRVEIGGEQRPVCCPGCKAVATLIRDAGLTRYYDSRDRPDPGAVRPAEDAGEWQVFDREDMLAAFSTRDGNTAEATIYVGGMYCAACSWLIDAALRKLPGIANADINPVTHRLRSHGTPRRPASAASSRHWPISATNRSRSPPIRPSARNVRNNAWP